MMRIKVTEVEANAEELRQSTTLGSALSDLMRRALIPAADTFDHDEDEEDEDES